jgi:dipeptidyl aminopeptidase/acylaminoacyl peptidase
MAIVFASLNTYKNELFTSNMVGTPILQQHGQDDDNVPVFHSRRMSQLVSEAGWTTDYWEIPGRGHW